MGTISTVSVDYGFFGSPGATPFADLSGKELPVLVVTDRFSKAVFCHPVQHKGLQKDGKVDDYPVKCLVRDLDRLGYKRINMKSDQEYSLIAVLRAVKEMWQGEISPEQAPRGDPASKASNGEVERAVQTSHGLARTLKEHVEQYARIRLDPRAPLLAWLVEYAWVLHFLFHVGADGMSAYHRLKGKPWTIALPTFGETVEFRVGTKHKLAARWETGVYAGVNPDNTERIVGTAKGFFVTQSIRRMPESQRFDSSMIEALVGFPWQPQPNEQSGLIQERLPLPLSVAPDSPEAPAIPVQAADGERKVRRYYITTKDLEKYGYTDGCPACSFTKTGMARSGTFHSPGCRSRIEAAITSDTERGHRFDQTQTRITEHLAKRVAEADAENQAPDKKPHVDPTPVVVAAGAAASSSSPAPAQASDARMSRPANAGGDARMSDPATTPASVPARSTPSQQLMRKRPGDGLDDGDYQGRDGRAAQSLDALEDAYEQLYHDFPWDAEGTLDHVLHRGRSRTISLLADLAREAGNRMPTCEETLAEYDLEETLDEESYWYIDDTSGKVLPVKLVESARLEELKFVDKIGLWEVVVRPTGKRVIGTRWVDTNKGDEDSFNIRARLVGQEIKHKGTIEQFFAGTPTLSSLKFLLSLAVTVHLPEIEQAKRGKARYLLQFIDVKKAHFWAMAERELYVELPVEYRELHKLQGDVVGRLKRSMYGMRDAAQLWERLVARELTRLGFVRGMSNGCVFYHPIRDLRTSIHGDNFSSLGARLDLDWFEKELAKVWDIKLEGLLGPPDEPDCVHQLCTLNRLLSWTTKGIEWESDPRHAAILVKTLVTDSGKGATAPGCREKAAEADPDNDEPLPEDRMTWYRSLAQRAAYLAQDRPDLGVSCREMAKGMQRPTSYHLATLKHLARYLVTHRRLVQYFNYQERAFTLHVWSDANHAGCIRTRKSTTGGALILGTHSLAHWCRGQAVIALSSGESEFYGAVTAVAELLGFVSLARDWNLQFGLMLHLDAEACIGAISRRGLGKAKHIDTVFLWIQEKLVTMKIKLKKEPTKEMVADVLTKYLSGPEVQKHLITLGFHCREGQHPLTLAA